MKTDCVLIVRKIPVDTRKQLKIRALGEGTSMQALIRKLIEDYLEEVKK